MITIGVLALQGAFHKHEQMLEQLKVKSIQVRYSQDLNLCDGLIIPGGESTAMTYHIQATNLIAPLQTFAEHRPVFGTCAGMILMSQKGILPILDISVERNGYGRQRDSFIADVKLNFSQIAFSAYFIRAPRITHIHSSQVNILAEYAQEPVLIQQNDHLAASFHPELTNDPKIHQYFIELCKVKQSHLLP